MIRRVLSRHGITAIGSILALGILFSACRKNDDVVQPPVAALMAFNLAADQPGVGIALSGNMIPGSPLPYTSFTGNYINIYPGNRVIESFNPATNQTLDSLPYTFEPNKYYSLFVVGANNNYKNIVSVDNYDSLTASSGKAYIRYINAIPDSSASTVTVSANGSNVVNSSASFGKVSDFVAVNPGDLSINITNEGSVHANRTITVEQQQAYTVLLMGLPNQSDSAKAVQIRFIRNGTITD